MKLKLSFIIILGTLALASGCESHTKTPTQKEEATKQWNTARAAVLVSLARSQFEGGNIDKAEQTANEAMRLAPEQASIHILVARIMIEKGMLEQADKSLAVARKLNPNSAEADYLTGLVYQRWQKPEMAYEHYLSASQKEPTELAYLLARAETLVAMNCTPEAISVLKSKLDYFEHNPLLHQTIGQLLVTQGRYREAIESFKQAAALAPEDQTIREQLAMAKFENHEYREAGDLFSRLLKEPANAKRADLRVALGECQFQTGRINDARESFDTATQLDPASTSAWQSLAKVTLQLGDLRHAESVLHKAISLDPASGEAHLMLGYIRLRQNRLNDAMAEFQKSSALDHGDPVSLCMVGYVLEKSGKPEQAIKYYAEALKLKPGDELATRLMAAVEVSGN
jgi:tetratricopeptide (TPR) repeat protein